MMKWWLWLLLLGATVSGAEIFRDDFSGSKVDDALPVGWRRYGAVNETNFIKIVKSGDANAVRFVDLSRKETGIFRDFKVTPGKYYEAKVQFARNAEVSKNEVLRLQLRFEIPGGKPGIFGNAVAPDGITAFSGQAPQGTKYPRIYIYSSFDAQLDLLLKSFVLEESDKPFASRPR